MNAARDRHVAGVMPDWSFRSQQWHPATYGNAAVRERHKASRPMAVRRMIPAHQVEALKARWFAIGSLATSAVFGIGYELAHLLGSLLA